MGDSIFLNSTWQHNRKYL